MRSISVTEKCPRIWSTWQPVVSKWIWNRLKIFVSMMTRSVTTLSATGWRLHECNGDVNQQLQAHSQWISTSIATTTTKTDLFKAFCGDSSAHSTNSLSNTITRNTCKNCYCCHHSRSERLLSSLCLWVFFLVSLLHMLLNVARRIKTFT